MQRFILCLIFIVLVFSIKTHAQSSDSTRLREQAQIAVQKVDDNKRWLKLLTPEDLNELPVGIKETINNVTYKLAVSSFISHKTHIELTVFARIDIPQNPKTLFFGVTGLKMSHSGKIIGEGKLVLLGNVSINIAGGQGQLILKGDFNPINGQTTGDQTYLSIDCKGFKGLGIAADVIFSRNMLLPCDAVGQVIADENQKVKGSFQTKVSDWNDILVSLNLPKFQLASLDGFVFTVSNATFDFSDVRNSPEVVFPVGYALRHMTFPNTNLWRGVYIQSAEVMLPQAFERRGGHRLSFGTTNLILDNNGLTGLLYAKNILPYEEGNASGWKFSVDEFQVGLEASQLVKAGFKGCIGLPVAEADSLRYEAIITGDNRYQLSVSPKGKMDFKLWQAKVELEENSYVKLLLDHGRFKPEANLYGRFDMSPTMKAGDSEQPIGHFKGIRFRGLRIRTVEPYLTVDYLGYEGEAKLAGFPVSISDIKLVTDNNRADLAFNLNMTLQENAFKGTTRLTIGSRFGDQHGRHSYRFDRVRVHAIELKNVKIPGIVTLDGKVDFMNDDPIYGQGFAGGINAKFDILGKAEVQMRCVFGHSTFRYWFMDGKADLGAGIPLAPPLKVQGFAGGAYYRMRKSGVASGMMDKLRPNYIPDRMMNFGFKAGILFSVVNRSVVDGVAEFEAAFNANGGMKYVGLFGNARFMSKLSGAIGDATKVLAQAEEAVNKQLEGLSDVARLNKIEILEKIKLNTPSIASKSIPMEDVGGVSAYVGMLYDFNNKTFHANFDVYVNVLGGLMQGVGDRYRAGWAVMHFDPSDWYVHMGTPTDPIGLRFGIGGFGITTKSYFMLGSQISGSPSPPQEVIDILKADAQQLDYMRDLNALGTGRGIAFGSRLSVETGDITFLILYAKFNAGLGFDLMLKQYSNAHCKGSSGPLGINGWYANAQAYAYLQGELGVKVNLWFIKTRIPIIQGATAALVQAQLPNPSWFQGYLGVKVDVLGGLIRGNMRFKLTIGDQCEIIRDNPNPVGIDVISDFSPQETQQAVDVFTAPQVALNFSVDKDISIDGEGGTKVYRVVLEHFTMEEESAFGLRPIKGEVEWNRAKDVATFYSKDVLPALAKVKASVKVSFKEQKGGIWQTVYMNGKKAEESRVLQLTTGGAPETIPLKNIKYSWPVVGQRNFYREENKQQGVIQLKRGQPDLFQVVGFDQEFLLEPKNGNSAAIPMMYDKDSKQLRFDVAQVKGDVEYELSLISKPLGQGGKVSDVSLKSQQQLHGNEGDTINIIRAKAQEVKRDDLGKVILSYSFRSSQYGTFEQKMKSQQYGKSIWRKIISDVITLQQRIADAEYFDLHDLKGSEYTNNQPLVQPVALLDDDYFMKDIHPLNYKNYPVAKTIHLSRDTSVLGFVPFRALPVMNGYLSLVEQERVNDPLVKFNLPYLYDLPRIYKTDFHDLQNQVVNRFLGKPEQAHYSWLIHGQFPFIRGGHYKVNYQYVLPDGKKGSSYLVSYQNAIK